MSLALKKIEIMRYNCTYLSKFQRTEDKVKCIQYFGKGTNISLLRFDLKWNIIVSCNCHIVSQIGWGEKTVEREAEKNLNTGNEF